MRVFIQARKAHTEMTILLRKGGTTEILTKRYGIQRREKFWEEGKSVRKGFMTVELVLKMNQSLQQGE